MAGKVTHCSVSGCDRATRSFVKGMCTLHYQRSIAGKPLDAPMMTPRGAICSVDGCERKNSSRGLCAAHKQRVDAGDDLDRPIQQRSPAGSMAWTGWVRNPRSGYVYRSRSDRRRMRIQLQHRFVMEQALGRELREGENVHHLNGMRDDNRLENLELWSTSQPSGQRIEDKTAWAKEWLAMYEPGPSRRANYAGRGHEHLRLGRTALGLALRMPMRLVNPCAIRD